MAFTLARFALPGGLAAPPSRPFASPFQRPAAKPVAKPVAKPLAKPLAKPAGGDRTAAGILAILASTICFPLSDLSAQSLMGALPPLEVAWLRYVVFLLVCLPLLRRGRAVLRSRHPGLQVLRGVMGAAGTIAALVAFKYIGVPETTAIGFICPVFVTALAVLVLKEQVGLRRWAAAAVALAGVMVIVRPGAASFQPVALLPLGGAVAGAAVVICTRLMKGDDPRTTVLCTALAGTAILSVAVAFDFVMPTVEQVRVAVVVGLFGAMGTVLQIIGYRLAPASLLVPFTYVQLVAAGVLAFLFVGTVPSPCTVLGSAIIVGSALYTAARERARGVA